MVSYKELGLVNTREMFKQAVMRLVRTDCGISEPETADIVRAVYRDLMPAALLGLVQEKRFLRHLECGLAAERPQRTLEIQHQRILGIQIDIILFHFSGRQVVQHADGGVSRHGHRLGAGR